MKKASASSDFFTGLVFGFDVGTASLGWAVRKGDKFLDVGVLICPEGTNDLENRRGLRGSRRTLVHRQGSHQLRVRVKRYLLHHETQEANTGRRPLAFGLRRLAIHRASRPLNQQESHGKIPEVRGTPRLAGGSLPL